MRAQVALTLAMLATACGPGFVPGDRIDRTRIVQARAHAAGDPTRAWLLPGEQASIEYLVVSREAASDPLRTAFAACNQEVLAGVNGLRGCAGASFDASSVDVAAASVPTLARTVDVPHGLTPDFSTFVLTYLGICVGDGTPMLDALAPTVTCSTGASELYRYSVQVIPDLRLANHNPNIHDELYYLGDLLWDAPRPGVATTGCATLPASSSLPTVRMSAHDSPELIFGCSPDDRETYPAFDADRNPILAREKLDIAHYVTLGRISGSTRIDDDTGDTVSTRWTRPIDHHRRNGDEDLVLSVQQLADLPRGLLVRFWFVARDHRSGSDWVERDLCFVP